MRSTDNRAQATMAPPAPSNVLLRGNANIRINIASAGVATPAVELTHQIAIASLVPGLKLSNGEVEALAAYLPHFIAGFVQGRRVAQQGLRRG
ncbi:unnamed protein product [Penicillium discolor]